MKYKTLDLKYSQTVFGVILYLDVMMKNIGIL